MAGTILCNLPFIPDICRSSQNLKIVDKMFGRCIYVVVSLIYQTNQKHKHYENYNRKSKNN